MRRPLALRAEVLGRLDEARAEIDLPEAIHRTRAPSAGSADRPATAPARAGSAARPAAAPASSPGTPRLTSARPACRTRRGGAHAPAAAPAAPPSPWSWAVVRQRLASAACGCQLGTICGPHRLGRFLLDKESRRASGARPRCARQVRVARISATTFGVARMRTASGETSSP